MVPEMRHWIEPIHTGLRNISSLKSVIESIDDIYRSLGNKWFNKWFPAMSLTRGYL